MFGFVRLALPVSLVMAVSACGAAGAGDRPSGFEEYKGDLYRVDYPAGWLVRETDERATVEFNGPDRKDGTRDGEVRITDWGDWNTALRDKAMQFRTAAPRSGYRIEEDVPVIVNGAQEAHRFVVSYDARTVTGAKVRMRMTDTFVLTGERVLLELVVRAPKESADLERTKKIVDSFQVKEEKAWFGFEWLDLD